MSDLIDRRAVLDCIDRMKDHAENHQQRLGIMAVGLNVCALPSAEPERKRGEWVEYPYCLCYEGALNEEYIACSSCGAVFNVIDNCTETFNFCPNCGADMREEE